MLDIPHRNQIRIGRYVWIETKQNQGKGKLTKGMVKKILTHVKSHPHGIMVMLEDGQTGRVKKVDYAVVDSTAESVSPTRGLADLQKIEMPGREDMENEFKETFRYDRRMANLPLNRQATDGMKFNGPLVLAKAICSFGNSYSGGFVFLGVADNGDIVGLEEDKKLGNFADYEDKFANHVRSKLESLLSNKAFFASKIRMAFRTIDNKTICIIQVLPSNKPLYVKAKPHDEFYVRGPTARAQHMTGDDLVWYIMERFPNYNRRSA